MDKVKKILEGYVEWIALALGACFLLWMVYNYVYLSPVTVAVGQMPAVLPGSIDAQIWEGQGKTLKAQIDANVPPVKVAVPAFSETVARALDAEAPGTSAMPNAWNVEVMPPSSNTAVVIDPVPTGPGGTKVTALPVAPKPINIATSNGHSNTLPTADVATGTAAAVGTGNAVPPANGAVPVASQATDKAWVTVAVTVPSASALNAAFTQANIPSQIQLRQTTMLRVDLFRQEQDAAGNWGPEVQINPPPIDALPPMPPEVAANANAARQQRSYLDFAGKDVGLILRPAFFQWVQGDKWFAPGSPNPNIKADELVTEKFDPATYTGSLDDLDKEEKEAVMKARREAARALSAQRAAAQRAQQLAAQQAARSRNATRGGRGGANPPAPGGAGGGGAVPGGFVVADPDRAANQLALADGPSIFDAPPPMVRPPGADGLPGQPTDVPGMQAGPGGTADDLPKGSFDPATQKDFAVWAHDDTVRPGKTYRYRIRYSISSPVYATQQLCQPQALAAQLTITSDKSDWSAPVAVESDATFYASAIGPRGAVTFDVFKWQNGMWTMRTVNVDPGDAIVGTDWTVVDVRDIPNEPVNRLVVLASDNGIIQHDIKGDKKIRRYHELLTIVKGPLGQQPGAPVPGLPGGPGMAPPPPGEVPPAVGR